MICFDGSGVDSENILKRISKNNSVSFTNSNSLVKDKKSNWTVYNCLTSKYTVTKSTNKLKLIMKEYINLLAKELENFDEIYFEGHSHGGLKSLLFVNILGENENLFKKIESIFLHNTPPDFKSESLTDRTSKAISYLFGRCCVSDISAHNLLPDFIDKCEKIANYPSITLYNNINDRIIDGRVSNDFFIDKLRDYLGSKQIRLINETGFESNNHICRESETILLGLLQLNLNTEPSSSFYPLNLNSSSANQFSQVGLLEINPKCERKGYSK